MKKKRKVILVILFALYFFITIGYAYLTANLNINGSSVIQNPTWDIHFENIQVNSGSVEIDTENEEKAATIDSATALSYSVTLRKPGDFYEFTVDVKNDGSIDGMIENVVSTLNNEVITDLPNYLNYKVTYDDGVAIAPNHKVLSGEKETYKIKIEYKKDITEEDLPQEDLTLDLSFTGNYLQKDANAVDKPDSLTVIRPFAYHSLPDSGHPSSTDYQCDDTSDFRSDTYREKIKNIILSDEINPPENVIESWDISVGETGDVMAYVVSNASDNTMYDLYIQGNGSLNANPDSSFLFEGFTHLDYIYNIDVLNVSKVELMRNMFAYAGEESLVFTLDLGDHFDTSRVTDMSNMFYGTGVYSTTFTLDLGDKFDTSHVTKMYGMFLSTGISSEVMTLDLGDKFDTSNVTDMTYMFDGVGMYSTVFTLDLGDKFDTSHVTDMHHTFHSVGCNNPSFTLDLGDKFDTSNVTDMAYMFAGVGASSTSFTLDLGDKFDTSQVTNMETMFSSTGYSSTVFTLDLGDKFDTSHVADMSYMFENTGHLSPVFTLDLGDKFDTSNVTTME
ncbi:MAG: BspA family leucine-rich repeat surface protein, partial [Bacilli bacterium]|nr:BspA family leucine-rich repeat surface protein [Bacilli bacterium]